MYTITKKGNNFQENLLRLYMNIYIRYIKYLYNIYITYIIFI